MFLVLIFFLQAIQKESVVNCWLEFWASPLFHHQPVPPWADRVDPPLPLPQQEVRIRTKVRTVDGKVMVTRQLLASFQHFFTTSWDLHHIYFAGVCSSTVSLQTGWKDLLFFFPPLCFYRLIPSYPIHHHQATRPNHPRRKLQVSPPTETRPKGVDRQEMGLPGHQQLWICSSRIPGVDFWNSMF